MKGKLTVLMITAFVDMLGLAMIIPLLPFYATKHLGLGFPFVIAGVLVLGTLLLTRSMEDYAASRAPSMT